MYLEIEGNTTPRQHKRLRHEFKAVECRVGGVGEAPEGGWLCANGAEPSQ